VNTYDTRNCGGSSTRGAAAAVLALAAAAGLTRADDVLLSNGDRLTGKIGLVSGDVMEFNSPALGDISIKLANIKSYSTDTPATLRTKDRQFVSAGIKHADATQITTIDGKTIPTADVQQVNPPPAGWAGSVVANGALNRGNTNEASLGFSAGATLRRDTPENDDRLTLSAAYNYVRTGRGAAGTATEDNLGAAVKYDLFVSDKLYEYADLGYYHDRIARLNYRLTPGIGAGYQWIERKDLNVSTEAGVSYRYEDYETAPVDQKVTLRLAYHVDKSLSDQVSLFHDVEFLPAFENPGDYVLTSDAGIRANLTKSFFTEFKVVYQRNDRPAPRTFKDDLAFLLGVGWKFL
jgi:putative salt-induced outer membrane protein YdiY